MTINILELAEGLRATDFTAAYPTKAITAAGPAVLKNITIVNASVDIVINRDSDYFLNRVANIKK